MGRRDAVQVTLEVVARMRHYLPRLVVSYEPGWDRRGNGTSANYDFANVHHTASASSPARPFPTQGLLRDGRPGLSGPLCNEAGPVCTVDAPRIHVVAAFPANHAGASRASGPVPALSLYNPRARGLEIDYAGTVPMTAGQLLVAHVWTRANADVLAGGNVEHVRAHAETSITGKWDPGYAPGKTIDMGAFRRTAAALTAPNPTGGFLVALSDTQQQQMYEKIVGRAHDFRPHHRAVNDDMLGHVLSIRSELARPFLCIRSDPAQKHPTTAAAGTGAMVLAAPGFWFPIPSVAYYHLYFARGLVGGWVDVPPNEFDHLRELFLAPSSGKVDSGELARELAALLPERQAGESARQIAEATADELDARQRDRLGAGG